jgi:hypothetical protein
MYYFERFLQILVDPEYTTITMYDSPRLGDAFIVASLYALATSLDSFLAAYLRTDTFSVGLLSFLISTLTTYLLWAVLAMIFHVAAELLGGLGEFPNALGFVGLATAPLVFTSLLSIVLTVLSVGVFPDDPDRILPNIGLGLTLLGMAWGAPGVICYFGMKNAEKVHPLKAFVVTIVLYAALASLVLYKSDVL